MESSLGYLVPSPPSVIAPVTRDRQIDNPKSWAVSFSAAVHLGTMIGCLLVCSTLWQG